MKVLMLCLRVVFDDEKNKKSTTGYSYMVLDTIKNIVAEGVQVDAYVITDDHSRRSYCGARIINNNIWNILANIKLKYLLLGFKRIFEYRPRFRIALTMFYYYVACGLIEKYISTEHYDVVHIHGLGFGGRSYTDCCELIGQNYIVTFHSMTSFSARNIMMPGLVKNEEDYLKFACSQGRMLTTISSKMKEDVCNHYNSGKNLDNISVVLNGISRESILGNQRINIREKYGIDNNRKILLSIGNITETKNQISIIRAIGTMSESERIKICVLFLGNDLMNGALQELAKELKVEDSVRFCGNIDRMDLANFYEQADLNMTVSVSEAFGLPVIEGFFFGVPSLIFADLEAVNDLYSKEAMVKINNRSDEGLAEGIHIALGISWDKEKIIEHSKRFSIDETTKGYLKVYRYMLNGKKDSKYGC